MILASAARTPERVTWADTLRLHVRTAPVFLCKGAMGYLIYAEAPWWALLIVLLLTVHFMHACLIAFHEAAHRNVAPNKWYNDAVGLGIGTFAFMSLTLYRTVHRMHHARLGAEEDDELWPFNRPGMPRVFRVAAATFELGLGIIFTPLLFLRAFLRKGTVVKDAATRRRVWAELTLIAVVWAAVISDTAASGHWLNFMTGTLIPAILAGNVQSWRKYVEHVGLTANDQAGGTRSIDAPGPVGRLLSDLMLHEPYHGVHHRYAALPHAALPAHRDVLPVADPDHPEQPLLFPSYLAATADMLRCLPDPKVGGQWLKSETASATA